MRALNYSIEQAMASAWRGRGSSLMPIITIALALFVLGGFLLLMLNVQRMVAAWEGTAELSVYLQDQATPADRAAIEQAIDASPIVAGHQYVSKTDAKQRFAVLFPDLSSLTPADEVSPFPASIDVQFKPGAGADAAVETLAASLQRLSGVSDTRFDRRWIARLVRAADVIGALGLVLAVVLSTAGALTVASVVRLALVARRDEVEIMRLVGAPLAFIRGPFITEGILHGGAGSVLALVLLAGSLALARARYGAAIVAALGVAPIWFLPLEFCGILIAGGMAVGGLGGIVAAWRGGLRSVDSVAVAD
jgi:cell division transport system permease protein